LCVNRCPENPGKCLLGSVPDPCGCCQETGLCARLLSEPCWNASIPFLPPKSRNDGYCARNYLCELRSDLQEKVQNTVRFYKRFLNEIFKLISNVREVKFNILKSRSQYRGKCCFCIFCILNFQFTCIEFLEFVRLFRSNTTVCCLFLLTFPRKNDTYLCCHATADRLHVSIVQCIVFQV